MILEEGDEVTSEETSSSYETLNLWQSARFSLHTYWKRCSHTDMVGFAVRVLDSGLRMMIAHLQRSFALELTGLPSAHLSCPSTEVAFMR